MTGLFEGIALPASANSRRDHLTFRGNVARGRHGWLRLTPAYSLHIVREILKESGNNEFVLEPFSGTGTTPLACAALGIPCHAIDINPFLVWLGNLKLACFGADAPLQLRALASQVVAASRDRSEEPWRPELHAIEKWWDPPVLAALAAIFQSIRKVCPQDTRLVDLLRVAFCQCLIKLANVSFGHQSMSFKRSVQQQIPLIAGEEQMAHSRAGALFLAAVHEIAEGITSEQPRASASVHQGDSRNMGTLPRRGYTRVITSPPYPNRMSYVRELRPYMYWLGYLTSGRQAGELDWQAIGGTWGCATSNLGTWIPCNDDMPFEHFSRIVAAIGADHKLLGRYVHKYFEDIHCHIRSLKDVLTPGARCHYVVGNSKFYGTMLPVEQIYAALFRDAGFENVAIQSIRKRSSKKELFEFVVYAEMPRGAVPA